MPATRRADPPAGEHAFLETLRKLSLRDAGRGVLVGIGDDAAVVRGFARTVLTTDTMIEGVHFRAGWLTARELGVRAWRAAVSDVAAMGARPRYALLSLEIPSGARGFDRRFATGVVRALSADARASGAALVGGNIACAAKWGVTVTVVGEARARPVTRAGARAGDVVLVTGRLGGAAAGVALLKRRGSRADSASTLAYRRPPCRVTFALAVSKAGLAHAMIDVSDGLLQDLGHVARRSGVTIHVDSGAIPIHAAATGSAPRPAALAMALGGGEDYELALTVAARNVEAVTAVARRERVLLTEIGRVARGSSRVVVEPPVAGVRAGFDHLR